MGDSNQSLEKIQFEFGELRIINIDSGTIDTQFFYSYEGRKEVFRSFKKALIEFQNEHGEEKLREVLSNHRQTGGSQSTSLSSIVLEPFSCDNCHKTWPGDDNQTPNKNKDICPECR